MGGERRVDKVKWFFERWLPVILGSLAACVSAHLVRQNGLSFYDDFAKILDSVITFSSIMVGFVGVLLGILFSIKDSVNIGLLFQRNERQTLLGFFKSSIVGGLALVVVSGLLYVHSHIDKVVHESASRFLFYSWIFLVFYVFAATYRIIRIMMFMIFDDDSNENMQREGIRMDPDRERALQERIAKR